MTSPHCQALVLGQVGLEQDPAHPLGALCSALEGQSQAEGSCGSQALRPKREGCAGFGPQTSPHVCAALYSPERSCLMRPLLVVGSTGRKSLNQEISGSGFPPAAHNMVAVRAFSTTFSWGPMSMEGKPGGSWSSADKEQTCVSGPGPHSVGGCS